jgi:hypothetical protein
MRASDRGAEAAKPGRSGNGERWQLADAARDRGVLLSALGPTKVRLVTHLDVSAAQAREAGNVLTRILV